MYESCDPGTDSKGFWKIIPFKWMVIFTWSPVPRSCCYHFSYYFGLDFAFSNGCSQRTWPPRIEAVATRVYSTKMLHRLRSRHVRVLMRRKVSPLVNRMFLDSSRSRRTFVVIITCPFYAMSRVCGGLSLWLVPSSPGSSPDRDIALCSWARQFTLTVPLSSQVYDWGPANLVLSGNPVMD